MRWRWSASTGGQHGAKTAPTSRQPHLFLPFAASHDTFYGYDPDGTLHLLDGMTVTSDLGHLALLQRGPETAAVTSIDLKRRRHPSRIRPLVPTATIRDRR